MQDIILDDNTKKTKSDDKTSQSKTNDLDDSKKKVGDDITSDLNAIAQPISNNNNNNNRNNNSRPPMSSQPTNNWGSWDDSFNSWGNDSWGSTNNNQNQQSKKMTPEERVQMIEKVYQDVLKRKPDTRDINYYKYSTLNEDEIKNQLLNGKEHTELVENGREFSKMKERTESAEIKVKVLESQIRDQVEEFKKLGELLKAKNRFIIELRDKLNNKYHLPD